MNSPLTDTPAYLGLFASLLLALACNAFLDIQYGGFAFEVAFWALLHAWSLRVGWRQQGRADESGKRKQGGVLIGALLLTVLVFIPMWGFPRAGLYLLAALQAAQNCVTTTRRQLHLGLLVSAVMVIFAASHHRADWTMLFYLIPYIVAVVFTLVAEQIGRRARSVRAASLRDGGRAGQGLAIAAATATILGLAGGIYALTPQPSWPYLASKYGQAGKLGWSAGDSGEGAAGRSGGQAGGSGAGGASGVSPERPGEAGQGPDISPGKGWPTPGQMREAAARAGMPAWQAGAIVQMADLSEAIAEALAPLREALDELLEQLAQWLAEHRRALLVSLFALILLMLLLAFRQLLREASARTWLQTRLDYWYLVKLGRHAPGRAGAIQFYRAMERLFAIAGSPRAATANPREFLREATHYRDAMRPAAGELTKLFEQFRYGPGEPDAEQIARMRVLYRMLFAAQRP